MRLPSGDRKAAPAMPVPGNRRIRSESSDRNAGPLRAASLSVTVSGSVRPSGDNASEEIPLTVSGKGAVRCIAETAGLSSRKCTAANAIGASARPS